MHQIIKQLPHFNKNAIFKRLEETASRANLTEAEQEQYEAEWKYYNDYFNTIDYAKKEGREDYRVIVIGRHPCRVPRRSFFISRRAAEDAEDNTSADSAALRDKKDDICGVETRHAASCNLDTTICETTYCHSTIPLVLWCYRRNILMAPFFLILGCFLGCIYYINNVKINFLSFCSYNIYKALDMRGYVYTYLDDRPP